MYALVCSQEVHLEVFGWPQGDAFGGFWLASRRCFWRFMEVPAYFDQILDVPSFAWWVYNNSVRILFWLPHIPTDSEDDLHFCKHEQL